jgi:hypothetical protein
MWSVLSLRVDLETQKYYLYWFLHTFILIYNDLFYNLHTLNSSDSICGAFMGHFP